MPRWYSNLLLQGVISLSYTSWSFEATNIVAEYETLVLGLNQRNGNSKEVAVLGDAELVVQQVKGVYQTKHPRLKITGTKPG